MQLKWDHQFQFAGYYAAKELGYYHGAGLEVTLIPAESGVNTTNVVLRGNAEYGVGSSGLLLARSAGNPLVVLAVIMQHSPFILIARQEATLNGIQGLAGKRIMLEPMSDEIIALLNHNGLPLGSFEYSRENSYSLEEFINGEIDAIDAYSTDEPYELMQRGVPFNVFQPRAAGIDFYGDNLFTTENELHNHPERVRRFREASLKGWRYAMAHPDEIIDLILRRYPTPLDRDALAFEAQQMQQLVHPELIDIGYMLEKRWRHIADTYASLGMLPRQVSLEGFIYDDSYQPDYFWFYVTTAIALSIITIITLVTMRFSKLNKQLVRLLHIKSQFANIGEAVNNISHQWKQPLNELGIQLMRIEQISDTEGLPISCRMEISKITDKGHTLLDFMATTVDAFSHALRTGNTIKPFSPNETIQKILYLTRESFESHSIVINFSSSDDCQLEGNATEFSHVILSILNNARDIFIERSISDAQIDLCAYTNAGSYHLDIFDNAGGITATPIEKIFELGYSDKLSADSGVGLYIAKKIVVASLHGTIDVHNHHDGALFKIAIPLYC